MEDKEVRTFVKREREETSSSESLLINVITYNFHNYKVGVISIFLVGNWYEANCWLNHLLTSFATIVSYLASAKHSFLISKTEGVLLSPRYLTGWSRGQNEITYISKKNVEILDSFFFLQRILSCPKSIAGNQNQIKGLEPNFWTLSPTFVFTLHFHNTSFPIFYYYSMLNLKKNVCLTGHIVPSKFWKQSTSFSSSISIMWYVNIYQIGKLKKERSTCPTPPPKRKPLRFCNFYYLIKVDKKAIKKQIKSAFSQNDILIWNINFISNKCELNKI